MDLTKTKNNWDTTLDDFHCSSNEIFVNSNYIYNTLLKTRRKIGTDIPIKWIDIGPGNGSKIWTTLIRAKNVAKGGTYELTLLEPSHYWREQCDLKSSEMGITKNSYRTYPYDFNTFYSNNNLASYHLTTLIHVVYDDDLLNVLLKAIRKAKNTVERYSPIHILVITESPFSDFAKIRQRLQTLYRNVPFERISKMRYILDDCSIKYEYFETEDKYCQIDFQRLDDHQYWLYAFILGITVEEFVNKDYSTKCTIMTVVKEFIAEGNKNKLSINDHGILITL